MKKFSLKLRQFLNMFLVSLYTYSSNDNTNYHYLKGM